MAEKRFSSDVSSFFGASIDGGIERWRLLDFLLLGICGYSATSAAALAVAVEDEDEDDSEEPD